MQEHAEGVEEPGWFVAARKVLQSPSWSERSGAATPLAEECEIQMSSKRSNNSPAPADPGETTPQISTWVETLDAAKLLERTEALELLVAASREDRSPEEALLEHFRNQPEAIERLSALQSQMQEVEVAKLTPEESQAKSDHALDSTAEGSDVTQAGSRRGRKRNSSSRYDSVAKPSQGDRSTETNPSSSTEAIGESDLANFETLGGRGARSKRSQGQAASRSAQASRTSKSKASGTFPGKHKAGPRDSSTWRAGWERYEVREEVGRGGCGVVERAYDRHLRREVVIKRIVDGYADVDEIVQRFVTEAQVTGQLEHPGIVPVHEIGEDQDGNPFFVMKEVRGETLADKISELQACTSKADLQRCRRQLLDRFLAVCRTLAFAHDAGVIHRDIKPANIMVGEFGETLLLDWGLARNVRDWRSVESQNRSEAKTLVGGSKSGHSNQSAKSSGKSSPESDVDRRTFTGASAKSPDAVQLETPSGVDLDNPVAMTQQGTVLGTAAYMSPEQAKGLNAEVDERSDVFSLGVVLYEILTGTSPFRSNTVQDTIERVARCDFAPVRQRTRGVPRAVAAICDKAMHRSQEGRYACAAELAADVESYLAGGRVQAYPEPIWERLDRAANNNRGLYRAVFASCLLIAIGATFAATQIGRAHQAERKAKLVAMAASEEAAQARDWEMEARKHTEEQFAASREAADQWLLKLSGDLQYYPGMQTIRNTLIREGVEHYEALCRTSENRRSKILADRSRLDGNLSHEAYLESIYCSLRLGDLYRLEARSEDALKQYRHAIALVEERRQHLLSNPATTPEHKLAGMDTPMEIDELETEHSNAVLGEALIALESVPAGKSNLEADQSIVDPLEKSSALEKVYGKLQASVRELEAVVDRAPSAISPRNALARSLLVSARFEEAVVRGESSLAAGRGRAMERLDAALRHSEILQQTSSDDRFRVLTSTILEERARLASKLGDSKQAIASGNEWYFYAQRRVAENPQRPDLLESKALAGLALGTSLSSAAKHADALHALEDADRDLSDSWKLLFGQNFYRANAAVLASTRADVQIAVGDFSGANQSTHDSIENLRILLQSEGVSEKRIGMMLINYLRLLDLMWRDNSVNEVESFQEQILKAQVLLEHLESAAVSRRSPADTDTGTQVRLWRQHLRLHELRLHQLQVENLPSDAGDPELSAEELLSTMAREHDHLDGEARARSAIWLAEATLEQCKSVSINQVGSSGLTERLIGCELDLQFAIENGQPSVQEKAYSLTLQAAWRRHGSTIPTRAARLVSDWVSEMPRSAQAWHWQAIVQLMAGQHSKSEHALHEAIRFRDGKPTTEDKLLELLIRSRQPGDESPLSKPSLKVEAQAAAKAASFKASHADLLLDLFGTPLSDEARKSKP